jgi:hypothetical protein
LIIFVDFVKYNFWKYPTVDSAGFRTLGQILLLRGFIAVPTAAWHRELRMDVITFIKDQQEGMDMVARVRVREGDINPHMVEV